MCWAASCFAVFSVVCCIAVYCVAFGCTVLFCGVVVHFVLSCRGLCSVDLRCIALLYCVVL